MPETAGRLLDLPPEPFEYAEWRRCRVGLDYHVEVLGHWYRVPHRLARAVVEALARAMPMVRTTKPIGPFCRAKTCSTAERAADLRALARQVSTGIGLPCGF